MTIWLRQGKYLINVRSVKEMPEVFGLLFAPSERWGANEATQRQSEPSYGEVHDDKKEEQGWRSLENARGLEPRGLAPTQVQILPPAYSYKCLELDSRF